jgi:hypothetical protein
MWCFMAEISLSSNTVIRPYRSRAGSPRIVTFGGASTAASTAVIRVGQVVSFDLTSTSAHRLVRCSTAAAGILSTSIAGIAAQGFAPTAGTGSSADVSVWAADGQTEFIFPTKIAGTTPQLVGTIMALDYDSSLAIHFLSVNSTAGDQRVRITEVIGAGDTNGYVVGTFISSACSPAVCQR